MPVSRTRVPAKVKRNNRTKARRVLRKKEALMKAMVEGNAQTEALKAALRRQRAERVAA